MSADPAWQDRLLEPVQVLGVERLGADITIRMTVRARAGPHAGDGARELRRRLHQALSAAGFEYPWTVLPSSLDPEAPL